MQQRGFSCIMQGIRGGFINILLNSVGFIAYTTLIQQTFEQPYVRRDKSKCVVRSNKIHPDLYKLDQ